MKLIRGLLIAGLSCTFLVSCLLEDEEGAGGYTCNATATVLEMCLTEAKNEANLSTSKETCRDMKGVWSDEAGCPSGYKKQCKDGDKTGYFYAEADANASCTTLMGTVGFAPAKSDLRLAMSPAADLREILQFSPAWSEVHAL